MQRGILYVLAGLMLTVGAWAQAAENPGYKRLTTIGVQIPGGAVLLPPIKLADGLNAVDQQKVFETFKRASRTVEEMQKSTKSAPFDLSVTNGGKDFPGPKTARKVELYFFAKGKLEVIAGKGFIQDQISGNKQAESEVHLYTDEELATRKLAPNSKGDVVEQFGGVRMRLFDKVEITGSGRATQTRTDESVLVAIESDPRFAKDPQFPNEWRKLEPDATGKKYQPVGNPVPYEAFGAYVKATQVKDPADLLFIEYHLVFDEPQGWFGEGSHLISSKLPILTNDNVPKFRKSLLEKSK